MHGNGELSSQFATFFDTSKEQAQDALGNTPLHYACGGAHIDCIELFKGSNLLNVRNKRGQTALHISIMKECREGVEVLDLYLPSNSMKDLSAQLCPVSYQGRRRAKGQS